MLTIIMLKRESQKLELQWTNFRCPVLILHAEDDYIVPFNLGEQLFEEGKKAKENIAFIRSAVTVSRHKCAKWV